MQPDDAQRRPVGPRRRAAAVGAATLVATAAVALASELPQWEGELAERANAAPDWVASALSPVMQLGTVWAAIGIGYLIWLVRKDVQRGFALIVAALITRFAASGLKALIDRERPARFGLDIEVRDLSADGLGWPSAHAAIAAVTATMTYRACPRRARPFVVATAGAVGIARVVHGVHFVGDVVGGWALGGLIGAVAIELLDRRRSSRSSSSSRG